MFALIYKTSILQEKIVNIKCLYYKLYCFIDKQEK